MSSHDEISFVAKVNVSNRSLYVIIPKPIRIALNLHKDDIVEVKIRVISRRKAGQRQEKKEVGIVPANATIEEEKKEILTSEKDWELVFSGE